MRCYNYLRSASRHWARHKTLTAINLVGFVLSLLVALSIMLYAIDDLRFNHQVPEQDRIFRVVSDDNTKNWISAVTSGPLIEALKQEISEIPWATRFAILNVGIAPIHSGEQGFPLRNAFVDSDFFHIFQLPILKGRKNHPLATNQEAYLTEAAALRLFGNEDENIIGKRIQTGANETLYVAGIVATPPPNSHLQFDVLRRFDPMYNPQWWNSWENLAISGYIKTVDQNLFSLDELKKSVVTVARRNGMSEVFTPLLQAFPDIHYGSNDFRYDGFNFNPTIKSLIYGLMAIAFAILLVAMVNFINLSMALFSSRIREIAMRKILGASQRQIILQLMSESVLLTVTSMLLALWLFDWLQPYIEFLLARPYAIHLWQNPLGLLGLFGFAVLLGIFACFYPTFALMRFPIVSIIKTGLFRSARGQLLRKILVIFQFAVCASLIMQSFIINLQIDYVSFARWGFDRDLTIVMAPNTASLPQLRTALSQIPNLEMCGSVDRLPGRTLPTIEVALDVPQKNQTSIMFDKLDIDSLFIQGLNICLKEDYLSEIDSHAFPRLAYINEKALRILGWDNVRNKSIHICGVEEQYISWKIAGVVQDFHFHSFKRELEPMVLLLRPEFAQFVLVRPLKHDHTVLNRIRQIYAQLFSGIDWQPFSLNQTFQNQFTGDLVWSQRIALCSLFAAIIASLGLIGLMLFSAIQMRKEIAIRKVMGAHTFQIVRQLLIEQLKLILIANVFAAFITFVLGQNWLRYFPTSAPNLWLAYLGGILLSGAVGLLSIGFLIVKTANTEPAKVLQDE